MCADSRAHIAESVPTWTCPTCGLKFYDEADMKAHAMHHPRGQDAEYVADPPMPPKFKLSGSLALARERARRRIADLKAKRRHIDGYECGDERT